MSEASPHWRIRGKEAPGLRTRDPTASLTQAEVKKAIEVLPPSMEMLERYQEGGVPEQRGGKHGG